MDVLSGGYCCLYERAGGVPRLRIAELARDADTGSVFVSGARCMNILAAVDDAGETHDQQWCDGGTSRRELGERLV